MPTPALSIPIRANLDAFKKDMNETSALAGKAATQVAKKFIDLNATTLAASGTAGQAALGLRSVLGVMGPLSLAIGVTVGAFKLMGTATELAKERIEEFYKIAERAGNAGVSTDFFQRITQSGERLKLTVEDITAALDKFAQSSKARLGGSDLDKRLAELAGYGNFANNPRVAAVSDALGNEAKMRAVVDLITDALAKGERLAALDLAEKAFGSKVADNLRSNSTYLREMVANADKIAASKIVSDDEIGRAVDLKNRLEEAQKVLTDRLKPIQNDLAKLGMNYHESWVGITETMASAVGVANRLYDALKEIPDIFARAGSAPFWTRLTEISGSLGLNSDPASLGIESITSTGQGSPANAKLAGLMSNAAAVKRAMQEAIDIETKVRGDRSKAPPAIVQDTSRVRDPFETALDQGDRRIAIVNADTTAIGQNSETRERARIVANLEEAAKRANAAAGKELYGITEATNPKIAEQADKMLAAAKAARVQQTAFDGVQDALRYSGNEVINILDRMGQKGANFGSIMADVMRNLSRQMLMAAITGEGAFGKLFGLAGTNGGVGGLFGVIGSLFTGGVIAKADGGLIVGPGGPREDAIPAMVSAGEFIVKASATSRHRGLLEAINSGNIPRFADGGFVGAGSAPMLGAATTIAPTVAVTVQGSPGQSAADHAAMGDAIGKAAMASIREMIVKEMRTQQRPGGMLR